MADLSIIAIPALLRYAPHIVELVAVIKENYRNPLVWSFFIKLDALKMTHRIRKYILNGDVQEASRLKDSFKDTLALEAVAAAIIAQIAVTLINLPGFGQIHWTATAFAYTSLVSGILATFFSFYVQQILGSLHSAEDVQEWLTSTRTQWLPIAILLSNRDERTRAEEATKEEGRIPSLVAAATLTAPARLLFFSIVSLIVALGVYLGSVYTANLGELKGSNANLGVLLFFVIFTAWAVSELTLPLMAKEMSSPVDFEELRRIFSTFKNRSDTTNQRQPSQSAAKAEEGASVTERTQDPSPTATQAVILEALRATILAQEESLRAQKALLHALMSNEHKQL